MKFWPSFGPVLAVYGGLFVFGLVYNVIVGWLERHGYDEGYTAWLVAGGVLVTLAGVALMMPGPAVIALGAFVASGFPMAVGSWWRHVQRRKAGQEARRDEVLHDSSPS